MAKNKSEVQKKDKGSDKLKKDKKALKKQVKFQDKRAEELDKLEKKLKKKAKKLRKKEEELLDLLKVKKPKKEETEIIEEMAEKSASQNLSDHLPKIDPIVSSGVKNLKNISTPEKNVNIPEVASKKAEKKPSRTKNENKKDTSSAKSSTEVTVRQGFDLIRKMDNEQSIREFLAGDERKTMQDAGERRIKQLQS